MTQPQGLDGDGRSPSCGRTTTPEGRSRRWRLTRALSWVAAAVSVMVLGATGAGYALLDHYDGNIARIPGLVASEPAVGGSRTTATRR